MPQQNHIRVIMRGRTGNNLFQYAIGRVLSVRHSSPLVMDGSLFRHSDWKTVRCIGQLPIHGKLQRGCTIASRGMRKLTGKHPWELLGIPVIKEPNLETGFNPEFIDAPANCVISGFFQSARYFESIEQELRRELDLTTLPWSQATDLMARTLADTETVAVHVRRTDYVGRDVYDLCGLSYYNTAIARMRDQLDSPKFLVFSDDPGWCEANLASHDVDIVAPSDGSMNPLHDLYLMRSCRHHIIANSSYSWWAAWLGKHPEQLVLAPDRWYGGDIVAPIEDRLCDGWNTIAV